MFFRGPSGAAGDDALSHALQGGHDAGPVCVNLIRPHGSDRDVGWCGVTAGRSRPAGQGCGSGQGLTAMPTWDFQILPFLTYSYLKLFWEKICHSYLSRGSLPLVALFMAFSYFKFPETRHKRNARRAVGDNFSLRPKMGAHLTNPTTHILFTCWVPNDLNISLSIYRCAGRMIPNVAIP